MTFDLHELTGEKAEKALAEAYAWCLPQVLGYHHPAYQRMLGTILGDHLHCLAVVTPEAGLCGVLPFRVANSPHGRVLNAFPFFGCTGMVAAKHGAPDVLSALMRGFQICAHRGDVFTATLYSPCGDDPMPLIAAASADAVVVKFGQSLDLASPTVWPTKRRADIARAKRRGYAVRGGRAADAPRLAELYTANCAGRMPMKPSAWIDGTLALSENVQALRWLVAEHDGVIQAGLLYGLGPVTASYILPCVAQDERTHQPMALLLDVAIASAKGEGARVWNFESSPSWNDPVFKYKQRWGAAAYAFAVLTFYGRRGRRPDLDQIDAVRAACPHYFVAPMEHVSGSWPNGVALPASMNVLSALCTG